MDDKQIEDLERGHQLMSAVFVYKASKSLLPCFLLTTSIGFCYAFSLFAPYVCEALNASKASVQFAFCLNIFFLGTGASCFGALVEKDIKLAAWLSTLLLFIGLALSGIAMHVSSIMLFYAGLGACAGIAEGIGYIVPVKNLLLWFGRTKHKSLVMAISIVSFGLGSTICTILFKHAFPLLGISNVFFFFAVWYLAAMVCGSLMIDKPKFAKIELGKKKKKAEEGLSMAKYLKDSCFWQCWLFMLLNISAGLVIIGQCASMLSANGASSNVILGVMMLCGVSNGLGRLVFPAASDYFRNRADVLLIALVLEIGVFVASMLYAPFIPAAFVVVNATYGCFFALLPGVLLDFYGKDELSFVHGLVLQAWASASALAFFLTFLVASVLKLDQNALFAALVLAYAANFANVLLLRLRRKQAKGPAALSS